MLIPLDLIENGQRLRGVSEAHVQALVNSIADVGLLNPISVYPRTLYRGGVTVEGYGLIAGLHRKTACERLGLVEIEANVLDLSDLERQIAECDENLCSTALTPAERATFTKRRKEAYEALHPEARHGGDRKSDQVANFATRSFAADQADKTGAAERTIRLDAERGDKVVPKAIDLIRNTSLDTGSYLDKLKKLPAEVQVKTARDDLKRERDKARKHPVKIAERPLNDDAAIERQVAALMSAWNKASPEAREEFMERIGADTNTAPSHAAAEGSEFIPPPSGLAATTQSTAAGKDRHGSERPASLRVNDGDSEPQNSPDIDLVAGTQALPVDTNQERGSEGSGFVLDREVTLQRPAPEPFKTLAPKAMHDVLAGRKDGPDRIPRHEACLNHDNCAGTWRTPCYTCRKAWAAEHGEAAA